MSNPTPNRERHLTRCRELIAGINKPSRADLMAAFRKLNKPVDPRTINNFPYGYPWANGWPVAVRSCPMMESGE